MIILDTNVVSELMKPRPERAVVRWVSAQPMANLYTTSITQAEILHGVLLLPAGKRQKAVEAAALAMFADELDGRVLAFGSDAAPFYAQIAAARRSLGRPISHFDAQIAAIARACGASVATRNVVDFDGCGVFVVDPWHAVQ